MSTRVTSDEVKEIIDTDISDISTFITAANLIVTDKLGSAGLSSALMKEIERWLSAHFVAIRDQMPQSEKTGESSIKYQGKTDMGLDFTSYGQQVKLLDTSGILVALGKRAAEFIALDLDLD